MLLYDAPYLVMWVAFGIIQLAFVRSLANEEALVSDQVQAECCIPEPKLRLRIQKVND